jgi:D-glycero-alpha-D-manno-heptose 1-phosphate guanylyltransferase
MSIYEAVILAGGIGSRLKTVVHDRPKPMAEINGRPFLEYQLDYLVGQGITRAILSVGYKYESILQYFGNGYKTMELHYAIEDQPLGTGGGILNALRFAISDTLFIVNGDTFFPVSFSEMKKNFTLKNADLLIALHQVSNAGRYGTILTDRNRRILQFREKSDEDRAGLINGGIYLMKGELLLNRTFPMVFSFEKDFLEKYSGEMQFYGRVFENEFLDIGVPESYEQAKLSFFKNDDEK